MTDDGAGAAEGAGGSGGRDVVVPLRVYKTVTVFSTLIAVVSVVFGFVMLDAATLNGGLLRTATGAVLVLLGADVSAAELVSVFSALGPAFAVVGVVAIAFGAGVYVLGSRFRAEGMGKSQDDTDQPRNDG